VLLPQSGPKQLDFHFYAPKDEEKSDSAGDHINQWLLHQLRSSPLSVNLLASTFENEFGNIKSELWQLEVLHQWYRDGAIKDASKYRVYSAVTTSEERLRPGFSRSSSSIGEIAFPVVPYNMAVRGNQSEMGSDSGSGSDETATRNPLVVSSLPGTSHL